MIDWGPILILIGILAYAVLGLQEGELDLGRINFNSLWWTWVLILFVYLSIAAIANSPFAFDEGLGMIKTTMSSFAIGGPISIWASLQEHPEPNVIIAIQVALLIIFIVTWMYSCLREKAEALGERKSLGLDGLYILIGFISTQGQAIADTATSYLK